MNSDLIKLSKWIGKYEIRLVIFKNRISVYFDFPIMNGNCKIADQCKTEIISYLEEKGLVLDRERSLIVKSGIPCNTIIALLVYVEALLTVFSDKSSWKISANNFIGTVEAISRKIKKGSAHSILGQNTAISHLKEMGYRQIENNKNKKGKKGKSFFRKIKDYF